MERTRSGHTLVRIQLDGKDAGLCILDTGASGFVISKATADLFNLSAFGEVGGPPVAATSPTESPLAPSDWLLSLIL